MNNSRAPFVSPVCCVVGFTTICLATTQVCVLNGDAPQEGATVERPLKVLCYNVYNGFRGGRSLTAGVKWINSLRPDIVGLQELVGWNEERLRKTALRWDHRYAVTLKDGGYNIGLTSRQPIEVIERRTRGFHHGYLHCRTRGR